MPAVPCVSWATQSSALGSCPVHEEDPCCDPTSELPTSQRVIQQSFFHQELGTFPLGQSLSGAERQVQNIPPTLDRETFGCVYTLLLVQLPLAVILCWHLPVYFPLLQIPPGWAAQDRSTPPLSSAASPGYLWSQLWLIFLHPCRISLTQAKKRSNPFEARRQQSQLIFSSEICAEIVHASHPQTTGVVVTTPSTKHFFWDLLHQGSVFLIFKQLHLVFSEQLTWSYSPFMQIKALEVFVLQLQRKSWAEGEILQQNRAGRSQGNCLNSSL